MAPNSIPTWKIAEAKLSVNVNGVFVPFIEMPDIMKRFVRPGTFSTEDDLYELQIFGSATLIQYHGLKFAIITKHQTDTDPLIAPKAEKFVLIANQESKMTSHPPDTIHYLKANLLDDNHLEDILFCEFNSKIKERNIDFLDISNICWSGSNDLTTDYSFLIGYPSESVIIELDPIDELSIKDYKSRWIRQDLERSERQRLEPLDRLIFAKNPKSTRESVNPDGLSGCPVFSIVCDSNNDRHLRFDGIITDGKGDRFAVYPSIEIKYALDLINN